MTDNTRLSTNIGTGDLAVTFDVTFSGDAGAKLQGVGLFGVSGTAESWTINPINGSTANGLYVDVRNIQAGANLIGNVGLGVRATGGPTSYRNINAGATGVSVRGTTGQLYWLHVTNARTTPLYAKFYAQTAAPTSTDTPTHTFVIPSQGNANGAGFAIAWPHGIPFANGIGLRVTTGLADNDNGNPGANECVVNLGHGG